MKKYLPIFLILGLLLASCGRTPAPESPTLDPQIVGTVVAATMQAMTAAAAPPTQLLAAGAFQFKNVSLVIPDGLASGATGETVARVDPTSDSPGWDVAPEYTLVTLQGYITGERFHKPQIFVFPTEEYAQMNDVAAVTMNELRSLLPGTAALPTKLPHLPTFNAAQMFTAKAQLIPFGSGRGVRYVTQYSQAFVPVNNNELFYTFQGLTNDGKYYVSVQLPITAAILDGMPAPDVNSPDFTADQWQAYLDGMTKTINSFGDPFFVPNLEALDKFIQTITIAP
ncbi:MAG: hypothetical protein AB1750_04395 [Chloroflexota bacterium]